MNTHPTDPVRFCRQQDNDTLTIMEEIIMHCTRKILDDLIWVGADDRRLVCFEGVYGVPDGVSYNSYLLLDEKTVLFDTVDKAVYETFFDNVAYGLNGRKLDYLVVSHMEPDHAATLELLVTRYPEAKIVCNDKIKKLIAQFFRSIDLSPRIQVVREGDQLSTGRHTLNFVFAPMVHWPEVMMTFDSADGILFSADAFGTFGALNGRIFADEVDFMHDWLSEARRYYTNIVGKYGPQVQDILKKASTLPIKYICPLHGFVWRKDFGAYIEKYQQWSSYTPEEKGVMIAYASVYGHTENVANILVSLFLVYGLGMKIEGVALGTVIAQYAGLFTGILLLWRYYRRLWTGRRLSLAERLLPITPFLRVNRDIFLRTLFLVAVTKC